MASELEDLKKLRDITGAGILDCKKYLVRASNNLDEAVKLMRAEEGIKADKKSSRIAAEGVVYYHSTAKIALLIEINSETDFVAKSDDFITYVKQTANIISETTFTDYDQLISSDNETLKNKLEELRKNYVTKLGENIQIRRYKLFDKKSHSVVGYTHNNKIGALVVLKNSDEQLSKDICMQIVASNPLGLDESSIDPTVLASEKEVYMAELEKINKKDDIKRNIMEGKIKKFVSENTLLNQPFIKDSSLTLNKIIKDNEVLHYTRYELGEGIDKKKEDFAEEVYNQIK
jgi:elongation factor Ts